MTVEGEQQAKTVDPQASLRAELLGHLIASQFAIEAAMVDLAGADPTVRDQLRSQLSLIAGLQQQIGTAQGSVLSALRAEVTALAGNATAAVQEARTAASAASSTSNIATLARTAREQVIGIMAGMKDFEPYLKFSSPEDEVEYRKREAERRALIEAEQAKGTPKGDLHAADVAIDQMADAKLHGAGNSPQFAGRLAALTTARDNLNEAIATNSKGTAPGAAEGRTPTPSAAQPAPAANLDDAMAALREAGVTACDASPAAPTGPGPTGTCQPARVATSGRG